MPPRIPELGRFAEPALLILVSLSDGPKHGYAIMTDVEAGTGRPLGPGTLYAALARLEERGLIEAIAPVDRRRPNRRMSVFLRAPTVREGVWQRTTDHLALFPQAVLPTRPDPTRRNGISRVAVVAWRLS